MDIKPIKTDRDYRRALRLIARLMDAKPSSREGELLNILVMDVERWETEQFPIEQRGSTPGPVKTLRRQR